MPATWYEKRPMQNARGHVLQEGNSRMHNLTSKGSEKARMGSIEGNEKNQSGDREIKCRMILSVIKRTQSSKY